MNASPAEPRQASTLRSSRLLKLDDFEVWRRRGAGSLILAAALVIVYWAAWFLDRGIVANDHTAQYISFQRSFPLADGWFAAAALLAAVQGLRRRESAFMWLMLVGGAGVFLCALDVLYDVEHGIYTRGQGGTIELAINLATLALSIGAISVGWRFRYRLLGVSPTFYG
jgi:hypothetical protein